MALHVRVAALLAAAGVLLTACGAPGGSASSAGRGGTAAGTSPEGGSVGAQAPSDGESSAGVGFDTGQSAPPFTVAGLDGRQITDADLRAQGKPYILYFYATW